MSFREYAAGLIAASAALAAFWLSPAGSYGAGRPDSDWPNVLFIAVDDLRPQLNCYGRTWMHTPNMDRLAARGVRFDRAYCMVPTCGASRASLMTGIRPARDRFVNYLTRAEEDAPGVTTLNTHFKRHGYHTVSLGKVFHHADDNAHGWSERPWRPRTSFLAYQRPENQRLMRRLRREGAGDARGPAYERAEAPDEAYPDGKIAARAVADLRRLAGGDQPFFLAVGFMKPHLPFVCPQRYWDLYDRDDIELPARMHKPQGAPDAAMHNFGELRNYAGIPPEGPLDEQTARTLIHGYYACTSFTDAQVGKLLDEMDRLGLWENTIVVLWGDHGWNLGEHGLWCKHCVFETSMHAPLIVAAPGVEGGRATGGLTEFIDIYPSLCELAALPAPEHLQGRSFVPLMRRPRMDWKPFAIGRYRRGDTIRTDRYRYSEFGDAAGRVFARMMYDHETDPAENYNIADEAETRPTVHRLAAQLRAHKGGPLEGE